MIQNLAFWVVRPMVCKLCTREHKCSYLMVWNILPYTSQISTSGKEMGKERGRNDLKHVCNTRKNPYLQLDVSSFVNFPSFLAKMRNEGKRFFSSIISQRPTLYLL